jgi:putative multiple sugar transport system substrate-binding protein
MKRNLWGFRKVLALLMVLAMTVSMFVGCGTKKEEATTTEPAATEAPAADPTAAPTKAAEAVAEQAGAGQYIGIAMPTQSSERWIKDGAAMKEILEGKGYTVDLQYAEDDIPTQKSQIENMITKGAAVLVIAAIDGSTLSDTLDAAAAGGVKIISYDRLLVNTDAVSYYATFDNRKVGQLQAQSLVDGMKALKGEGPYNIELFAGSPDDTNSFYFFQGAMDVYSR